jgi:uncharacterized protein YkwD
MLARLLVSVCALLCAAGCSSSSDGEGGAGGSGGADASCAAPKTDGESLECQILAIVNEQRAQGASCGGENMPAVAPVEMHPILRGTARAHAQDMAQNDYFDHDSLDGRSPFDRMQQAGYEFSTAGENIAAGSSTAEATMGQWLDSPGHCKNIMGGQFQHIGVGYAFSESHQFEHVWVQNFASP